MRTLLVIIGIMLVTIALLRTGEYSLVRHSFVIMDTQVDFVVEKRNTKVVKDLVQEAMHLDKMLSFYEKNSCVSRLNRGEIIEREDECFPLLVDLVLLSKKVCKQTKGAFDPGFRAEVSIMDVELDDDKIKTKDGGVFDFSGIAKGYIVDRLVEMAKKRGIKFILINAGGDVRAYDRKNIPLRVEIKNPLGRNPLDVVYISNCAVATSGNYERGNHIIDPKKGEPVKEYISASAGAESCALADGWATALFVLGKAGLELAEKNGIAGMLADIGRAGRAEKIENRLWKRLKSHN